MTQKRYRFNNKGLSHIRFPDHRPRKLDWSFLEKSLTVKDIMKYVGIAVLILAVIIGIFMVGRWSVSDKPAKSVDTKEDSKSIVSSATTETKVEAVAEVNKTVDPPVVTTTVEDEEEEVVEEEEVEEEETTTPDPTTYKEATFGHPYSKVTVGISNPTRDIRGDDWATLDSFSITVVNGEKVIITPAKIKVKIYTKGKASEWWDDTIKLPVEFHDMKPGAAVTKKLDIHASFNEIDDEKEIKVLLLDEFDVDITTKLVTHIFS